MSRTAPKSRRSAAPQFRLKHAGIALLTLVVAWQSGVAAIVSVARTGAPDVALQLDSGDAGALAAKGNRLFVEAATTGKDATFAAMEPFARQALLHQAVLPAALRQLGYVRSVRNKPLEAKALMALSSRIGRRDFGTHLWRIEEAVERNDVPGALAVYHLSLTTSPEGWSLLFPRLAEALNEPEVRRHLVPLMRQPESWQDDFLIQALGDNRDPKPVLALVDALARSPGPNDGRDFDLLLVASLMRAGAFRDALRFYRSRSWADKQVPSSASLPGKQGIFPGDAMQWRLADSPDAVANLVAGSGLNLFTASSTQARIAQKFLYLSPGTYRLSTAYGAVSLGDHGSLGWEVRCATSPRDAAPLWTAFATVRADTRMVVGSFTIPDGCPVAELTALTRGDDRQQGSEIELKDVTLENM